MPEVFRFFGFSFFFFSREHEPMHIHVEGNGGKAVFDIVGDEIIEREVQGIKANDLKRIRRVVTVNKDIIIEEWNNHFGLTDKEDLI